MDHLDLPKYPKHPPISIPYLVTEPYDGEDFESYHERKGWTRADIEGSSACTKSLDERAAFLQTWLCFGLLSAFLGDRFDLHDYILIRPLEPSVVTLSKVTARLSCLKQGKEGNIFDKTSTDLSRALIEALSIKQDRQHLDAFSQDDIGSQGRRISHDDSERVARTPQFAHDWHFRVLHFGPYHHNLDLMCLSVAALGELLSVNFEILDDDMWLRGSGNNFLYQRMLDDGWCPTEIIRLGKMSTISQLYYISNMDRPGPNRSHEECVKRIPLGSATLEKSFARSTSDVLICTAYQMDWCTYKTKHVQGCGTCNELSADQTLMEEILRAGFFPLLRSASSPGRNSPSRERGCEQNKITFPGSLEVVSSEFHRKYVCISHVWSDGLGNPHANSIPQCQYQRLSDMVDALYPNEHVPFWIDTISVPRAPVDIRRRAIMQMRKTYWEAESILVLDSHLLDVDLQMVPEKDVWLRLLTCGWTRRLWTLQESALAKDIFLQLRGGVLNIDQCLSYGLQTSDDVLILEWSKLRGAWERWTSDLSNSKPQLLETLSDAVAWRSTSIAEDEAVCLGCLTGLDPSSVEQILILTTHEDRMMKFWELQQTLFTGILFWGGPRIQKFPYRWAPLSFLNQGPAPFLGSQSNKAFAAQPSEKGLKFNLPGVRLGPWRKSFMPSVYLKTGADSWYRLVSDMDKVPPPKEKTSLAVIFQELDSSFIDQLPPGDSMAALIVSIDNAQEGEESIYAKPEYLATIDRGANAKGWIEPLEKLTSRFYKTFQLDRTSDAKIELNGTLLGHYNKDSSTESDILAVWAEGQLAFDLGDQHIMFEAKVLSGNQEWYVG